MGVTKNVERLKRGILHAWSTPREPVAAQRPLRCNLGGGIVMSGWRAMNSPFLQWTYIANYNRVQGLAHPLLSTLHRKYGVGAKGGFPRTGGWRKDRLKDSLCGGFN